MPTSNDPQKIHEAFLKEEYLLLAKYKKAHLKIPFRCPNGHIHQISWNHFKGGKRCKYCAINAPATKEYLKALCDRAGLIYLSHNRPKHHTVIMFKNGDIISCLTLPKLQMLVKSKKNDIM